MKANNQNFLQLIVVFLLSLTLIACGGGTTENQEKLIGIGCDNTSVDSLAGTWQGEYSGTGEVQGETYSVNGSWTVQSTINGEVTGSISGTITNAAGEKFDDQNYSITGTFNADGIGELNAVNEANETIIAWKTTINCSDKTLEGTWTNTIDQFTGTITGAFESSLEFKANAGSSLTALAGDSVKLDGSKSYDPSGKKLVQYRWSISGKPEGSNATLDNDSAMEPTLNVDLPGDYVISLVVNNGETDSQSDSITITVNESDGSSSEDAGSSADEDTSATDNADDSTGDTTNDSQDDTVDTSTGDTTTDDTSTADTGDTSDNTNSEDTEVVNTNPIANAGADFNIEKNQTITLDGSNSTDPENTALTFSWTVEKPKGSSATIQNANEKIAEFTPDIDGTYTVFLVVNDGVLASVADTATITVFTPNKPPIANAGSDQEGVLNKPLTLLGNKSYDPEGTILNFTWTISTKPEGSNLENIIDPDSPTPSFTPDVIGTYTFDLVVNDGELDSEVDQISIQVVAAKLSRIEIFPHANEFSTQTSEQFFASGVYSDGKTEDLTEKATWRGMDDSVLVVSDQINTKGLTQMNGVGTTEIEASFEGISSVLPISVSNKAIKFIEINVKDNTKQFDLLRDLPVNVTYELTAIAIFEDYTRQDVTEFVTWSSGDDAKAIFTQGQSSKGYLKGVSVGRVTIEANWKGFAGSLDIDVIDDELLGMSINNNLAVIPLGFRDQFIAKGNYDGFITVLTYDDLTYDANWTSLDPTIADVNPDGMVVAKAVGSTTIKAEFSGFTAEAIVEVQDTPISDLVIRGDNNILGLGKYKNLSATATFLGDQTINITNAVQWRSLNSDIGMISNFPGTQGRVYGIGVGENIISASINGLNETVILNVENQQCGSSDIPLTLFDIDLPASIPVGTTAEGSVAYKGDFSKFAKPTMGALFIIERPFPQPPLNSYQYNDQIAIATNCRINFSVSVPEGLTGTISFDIRLVEDINGVSSKWDNSPISDIFTTELTITP